MFIWLILCTEHVKEVRS